MQETPRLSNRRFWWSSIACALAIFIGISSLSWATDDWQAWTAESARRLEVLNNPIVIPPVELLYQHGDKEWPQLSGSSETAAPLILMEFIFTRCPTVCLAMGAEFRQLQQDILASEHQDKVKLISVSFDPRDTLIDLSHYLQRFSADSTIWSAAKFVQTEQLKSVMHRLGVIVIPEPRVGFIHNAAVYVINNGEVVAILDHDDPASTREHIDRYVNSYSN